ncbi:MAG: KpsF/GutQ family sugar-phosphate isomerase [candidate division Zixibacteria bacterium]|nr:KpsF/GutQ family sugar-phosphate isomerase [candidate division Zixibacteria bacterium]
MGKEDLIRIAHEVINRECEAIDSLAGKIGDSFVQAVEVILKCEGRVIVTGMGKSGLIGKKIAATFNSTGTPSFFLHPAEGLHGDIGLVISDDVVLALSKSGDTEEVAALLTIFERLGVPIISITGNPTSPLADKSDVVLDVSVQAEAGPSNLIPTSSSTAAMVMGHALAIALLEMRNFSEEDFALLHPGGDIGRRLLKVKELMHTGADIPVVGINTNLSEAIIEMTSKRLGFTAVADDDGRLAGVYTDGDLRRTIENNIDVGKTVINEVMTRNPKTIDGEAIAEKAVHIMESYNITSLMIIDKAGKIEGVIHLHDLLKAKIV